MGQPEASRQAVHFTCERLPGHRRSRHQPLLYHPHNAVVPFNFQVARDGIYYILGHRGDARAALISCGFAVAPSSQVLTLDAEPVSGLSVSPDGRSLLFTQTDQQGVDLMLVEGFR